MTEPYGKELILDIHECRSDRLDRKSVNKFMSALCTAIDMEPVKLYFWEAHEIQEPDHVRGLSACQFIRTSSVVVHTLDASRRVFINIFSCKDFSTTAARVVVRESFGGLVYNSREFERD